MTEHNPEQGREKDMDPRDTFIEDQQAAATEQEDRHATIWDQQVRDAETTLAQREAVTKRLDAQTSLMTTLDALVWCAFVVGVIWFLGWATLVIVEAVQ